MTNEPSSDISIQQAEVQRSDDRSKESGEIMGDEQVGKNMQDSASCEKADEIASKEADESSAQKLAVEPLADTDQVETNTSTGNSSSSEQPTVLEVL